MNSLIYLLSGGFLGFTLGANDASNVFGVAVTTGTVKYGRAVIITAIFVIIGAYVDGASGIENLSEYGYSSGVTTVVAAFFVMLSAGITVMLMTVLSFPVSTSQCVIGAIIGWGLVMGQADLTATTKFIGAWVLTPIGAGLISYILYSFAKRIVTDRVKSLASYDKMIIVGYYIAGIIGAYSLGANNVANITALYTGEVNLINNQVASIIGGVSIAIGVLTYSKKVMYTVGDRIASLNPLSGFLVVLASAITVFIYAKVGIPVSSSQAIVGAVVGVGLTTGIANVDFKVLRNIGVAWFGTPSMACGLAFLIGNLYL